MAPTDGNADCEAKEKKIVRPDETPVDIPSIECPVEVVPAPSGVTNGIGTCQRTTLEKSEEREERQRQRLMHRKTTRLIGRQIN